MNTAANKIVSIWLFLVCACIVIMILFGGFVRLTRSGLSMVEWHVITGVLPPMGEVAWQESFAKYRQTPEFREVNAAMTLQGYKAIYLVEYTHRVLGRISGLVVVIPLGIFLLRGIIPLRRSTPYLGIALLFGLQGYLGWYMVQSGLVDKPSVSHYRLTIHLLMALALLTLCLWKGLQHATPPSVTRRRLDLEWAGFRWLPYGLLGVIVLQIAYGGLVAGLKAGHVSSTFPLMFGSLIPPGMFSVEEPWILNLVSTASTVHFVHRWFAFVVLGVAAYMYYMFRKKNAPDTVQKSLLTVIGLISLQILLGVGVILFHVPVSLAVIHQGIAILVFVAAFYFNHRLTLEIA